MKISGWLGLLLSFCLPWAALAAPESKPPESWADVPLPSLAPDPVETGEGVVLPTGRLQMVSGNARSAQFIALDQVTRNGDRIDLWAFTVFEPALIYKKYSIVRM